MTNAFRFLDPALQAETIVYWRQQLREVEPHSDLRVQCIKIHHQWQYTIQVRWGSISAGELNIQVLSSEAAV